MVRTEQQAEQWSVTPRFLLLALAVKLAATGLRWYVIFVVYNGTADAPGYDRAGAVIAAQLRSGTIPSEATDAGTPFMEFATGVVYALTFTNRVWGFVAFTLLSFLGLWLFHRAFVLAVPNGDHRLHAWLVFLLPTLLFWTSSIGKEAYITFGFGIAVYGAARVYRRLRWGYVALGVGVVLVFMVRPHMAALLVAAFCVGFLVRPAVEDQARGWAPWLAGVVVAVLASVLLVGTIEDELPNDPDVEGTILDRVVLATDDQTSQGGSGFENRPVSGLADLPSALVTVPFRPFPWEVLGNSQAMIAGFEGLVLLGLFAAAAPRLVSLPRRVWRMPMVAMAAAYTVGFCIAFSAIGNFGILARQRAQLLPFLVVLLCLPAVRRPRRVTRLAVEVPPVVVGSHDSYRS